MAENRGFTIWFTGMSGSGKSTLAYYLAGRLRAAGRQVEILDGDEIDERLGRGLSTVKEDVEILNARVGWVCDLLTRNGVISIATSVSPHRATREAVRRDIGRFVEIFTDCPVELLIERDPKGLYKKALAGDIPNFVGITEPYEPPASPEIVIDSGNESVEQSAERIIEVLTRLRFLTSDEGKVALFGMGKGARNLARESARKARSAAAKAKAASERRLAKAEVVRKKAEARAASKREAEQRAAQRAEARQQSKRVRTKATAAKDGSRRKTTGGKAKSKKKTTVKKKPAASVKKKSAKKAAKRKTAAKKKPAKAKAKSNKKKTAGKKKKTARK